MRSDPASFVGRFPELYATAYRAAFAPLGRRAEAEECAQEACARAYARWRRVEPYALAFVARVAFNLAFDSLRKKKRERNYLNEHTAVQQSHESVVADHRQSLVAALQSLPRRQREAVVLCYLADLPERSVASGLGCSVGTVKSATSRGLAQLRGVLAAGLLEGDL